MPLRESAPIGAPCWIELFTSDPDQARSFYADLFGWTSDDPVEELGGYINFHYKDQLVAGCFRNDGQAGTPDIWTVYLATGDAQATADAAAQHGGQVVTPALEVMDLGSMAVVTDAGQAVIGAWQPGTHRGFGILNEAGAPGWFELHTRDYDATVEFYRDVFSWDIYVASFDPDFRYTTLGDGDGALAGIMDAGAMLSEGVPAQWSIYFAVEDTDAALARIVDLGGSIILPGEDTPFGRLAHAADPTGAQFKLVSDG